MIYLGPTEMYAIYTDPKNCKTSGKIISEHYMHNLEPQKKSKLKCTNNLPNKLIKYRGEVLVMKVTLQ